MEWNYKYDKLPEKNKRVLCYDNEEGYQIGYYVETDHYEDGDAHIFKNDWDDYIMVSHWMELPESPKDNLISPFDR